MKIFNHSSRYLVAAALAATLVLAPFAYAEDDDRKGNNGNKSKEKSSLEQRLANITNKIFAKDDDKRDAVKAENAFEVRMAHNGDVTVRGAKVTAIGNGSLTAVSTWGNISLTWTVLTDSSTKFVTKGDKNSTLSGIKVGDSVSFSGKLASTGTAFSVNAKVIKNWSLSAPVAPVRHVFEGKLQSVATTTLPSSLSLMIGSKVYMVLVPANTPILNALWGTTTLSRFSAGDTVRVFGSLQAGSDSVIDAFVVRNASQR
ncbi:MAG TPA: DUF5666 domain-containing protein [Candidatus Paceibacterota bacterium]|nr:DUF5666 domain-containing protein [Candidatus Paceibacterota bacterium]